MKNICLAVILVLAPFALFADEEGQAPATAQVKYLAISSPEPAYTIYLGLPELTEKQKKEVHEEGASGETELLEWEEFLKNRDKYIGSRMKRNDYPGAGLQEKLPELIEHYPGVQVGLTWNGGIAISYNEFSHARRSYGKFLKDPEGYKAAMPASDPVNPERRLKKLSAD